MVYGTSISDQSGPDEMEQQVRRDMKRFPSTPFSVYDEVGGQALWRQFIKDLEAARDM